MDLDLDILGPFAAQYQKAVKQAEIQFTKQSVAPGTSAGATARRQSRANFTALYKKQNVKFIQDPETRRQGRQLSIEANRKMRRSQIVHEGRKATMSEMTNEFNQLIQEDSSNEISELLEESETASGGGSPALQNKLLVSQSQSKNNNSCSVTEGSMSKNISNGSVKDANLTNKNVRNLNNGVAKKGGTTPSITTRNGVNVNSQQDQNKKPPPPAKAISQSRHDQLQKWKKEKEAAELQSKRTQKQPFKVGAPVVTKPVKSTSSTSLSKTANSTTNVSGVSKNASTVSVPGNKPKPVAGLVSSRQPTVPTTGRVAGQSTVTSRVGAKPVPATAASSNNADDVRRITRAMSKVQTPSASINASGNANKVSKTGTGMGIAKPPIQKMKTLNINDKTTTTARPGTGRGGTTTARSAPVSKTTATNSASAAGKKPGVSGPIAASSQKANAKKVGAPAKVNGDVKEKEKSPGNDQPPQQSTQETSPPEQVEAAVKKKKAKPKAIDAIYTDYNGRFSDACRKLGSLGAEWRKILEENKESLSEEIEGDINSDLGKVKLLLESKLPQFGELLYAYLLKDEDATIILGCDLEGWWDVASIQVEAVYKRFEVLTEIKNNNWKKPEALPPPSSARTNKKSIVSSEEGTGGGEAENFAQPQLPRRPKPAVKAQASGGLKAFLAKQRKMANSVSGADVDIKIDSVAVTDQQIQPMEISTSLPTSSSQVEPSSNEHNSLNSEDTMQSASSKASLTLNLNQSHQDNGKMFEGGFFQISSPLSTHTPRGSRRRQDSNSSAMSIHDESMQKPMTPVSAVPVLLRTPNRQKRMSGVSSDASLRRASLSMLGVRKSMGSFSKIGVVSVFQEEKRNEMDAMLI